MRERIELQQLQIARLDTLAETIARQNVLLHKRIGIAEETVSIFAEQRDAYQAAAKQWQRKARWRKWKTRGVFVAGVTAVLLRDTIHNKITS